MKCPSGTELAHLEQLEAELRQITFDAALSTLGKACMKRCASSRLASSIACAVAATAILAPREPGHTIQPTS